MTGVPRSKRSRRFETQRGGPRENPVKTEAKVAVTCF